MINHTKGLDSASPSSSSGQYVAWSLGASPPGFS